MPLPYWEVDVSTQRADDPTTRGLHVFIGRAAGPSDALKAAHDAYDLALTARLSGVEIPGTRPGGWDVRSVRPGWQLDWPAATVGLWEAPITIA